MGATSTLDTEQDLRRATKQLSITVAVVLLLFLLGISAYIAWTNYQDSYPQGYVLSPTRSTPLTHDLAVTIDAQTFDPSTRVLRYALSVRAWLPPSTTDMWVHIFNGSNLMYFDIKTPDNQGSGQQVFLQMDSNRSRPYSYLVGGLAQRFPYDSYSLYFRMEFGSFDPATFPSNFLPIITFYAPYGWHADVVENVTHVGVEVTATARIILYREAVNSFQFFIPPVAIYAVLGASLFLPKADTEQGRLSSLQRKSIIYLGMIVLSFTLATSFVPGFAAVTSAPFLQATYFALLVGALLLQAFAILDASTSTHGAGGFSFWDYSALALVSTMPILFEVAYSFLAILPSTSYLSEYNPMSLFSFGLHFLDYRIVLWSVVFFALLWAKFFHAVNLLELPFLLAGLGILFTLALSGLSGDLALLFISFLYVGIATALFANRLGVSKYYFLFVSAFVVVLSILLFGVPSIVYSPLGLGPTPSFFIVELTIFGAALVFSKHQRIRLGFTAKRSRVAVLVLIGTQLVVMTIAGFQNFNALGLVENVSVGVAEELAFRGYVQGALEKAFGVDRFDPLLLTRKLSRLQLARFILPLVMASLIFALYHVPIDLQTGGTPPLGALGCQLLFGFVLSFAYLVGNNLLPLMLIHGFWDYDISYPSSSIAGLSSFLLYGIILLPIVIIVIPMIVKARRQQIMTPTRTGTQATEMEIGRSRMRTQSF